MNERLLILKEKRLKIVSDALIKECIGRGITIIGNETNAQLCEKINNS